MLHCNVAQHYFLCMANTELTEFRCPAPNETTGFACGSFLGASSAEPPYTDIRSCRKCGAMWRITINEKDGIVNYENIKGKQLPMSKPNLVGAKQ